MLEDLNILNLNRVPEKLPKSLKHIALMQFFSEIPERQSHSLNLILTSMMRI